MVRRKGRPLEPAPPGEMQAASCNLVKIPAELRMQIYEYYFAKITLVSTGIVDGVTVYHTPRESGSGIKDEIEATTPSVLNIRRICRLITTETQDWFDNNAAAIRLTFQPIPETCQPDDPHPVTMGSPEPLNTFLRLANLKHFTLHINVLDPSALHSLKSMRYMLTRLRDAHRAGRVFTCMTIEVTGWHRCSKQIMRVLLRTHELADEICGGNAQTEGLRQRIERTQLDFGRPLGTLRAWRRSAPMNQAHAGP